MPIFLCSLLLILIAVASERLYLRKKVAILGSGNWGTAIGNNRKRFLFYFSLKTDVFHKYSEIDR